MISHMLSIYDLLVLTDSEDECPERDDSRPLDHDEEIDIDDYEYFPDVYGTDLMSKLFLNIPDLMSFTPNDITHAVESIAVPVQEIHMEAMEFQNAVEKESVPPLNEEAARLFTASERILQNYARARTLTGAGLKALIEDVLRNPEFNADDIDRNMMERLNKAIDDGEFEIFDMWKEGDGHQDVRLFTRKRLSEALGLQWKA